MFGRCENLVLYEIGFVFFIIISVGGWRFTKKTKQIHEGAAEPKENPSKPFLTNVVTQQTKLTTNKDMQFSVLNYFNINIFSI